MTALNSKILITEQLRPCLVNGKKALFHRWGETTDIFMKQITKGIVEYEDGTVARVFPNEINFIPLNFNEYAFNTEVEDEVKSQ